MICSTRIANSNRRYAKIAKRRQPGFEYRPHGIVALQIDTTDLTRAIVVIEISGKLRVRRLELHGHGIAEGLFHIRERSEQPLFLAAPEAESYRAIHLQA